MSSLTDPQNPQSPLEPEQPGSDNTEETPLPIFDKTGPDKESLVKTVSDTLPQMEAVLKNQEPPSPPPPTQPVYQISGAEKDWSEYPVLSTDEPIEEMDEETTSTWQSAWGVIREVGETIILTLIIFFLIQTVIRNFRVVGTSMDDNLHNGQYLIIDKLTYSDLFDWLDWGGPQHGDVVVFEPPNRPDEDYVKRIVGLPGETIEVKGGQVWVNGEVLPQPFEPKTPAYSAGPVTVPQDHVYVLGDNRNNSNDSHNWGVLPIEKIVGRARLSYWPPELWGTIPNDAPTDEATLKYFLDNFISDANAESE